MNQSVQQLCRAFLEYRIQVVVRVDKAEQKKKNSMVSYFGTKKG